MQETAGGTTTDLYYSDSWQVLEERVASGGTSVPRVQYVWSPVYVDALILRDRDTNANGTLDERLYVVQDANTLPATRTPARTIYESVTGLAPYSMALRANSSTMAFLGMIPFDSMAKKAASFHVDGSNAGPDRIVISPNRLRIRPHVNGSLVGEGTFA